MRLLQIDPDGDFSLVERVGSSIPPYAILSHAWAADEEEVNLRDILGGTGKSKEGYHKIRFCSKQAIRDGLQYFWVDTCCIDKTSSAELSEAINSFFRWYENAKKCYVYLSDVSTQTPSSERGDEDARRWKPAFRRSKWFTRGWTLQELIAPASVEFFSAEEERLGDKQSLEQTLHEITGIPILALRKTPLSYFTVRERKSWAAQRQTTREEDKAYCLLGIFDIQMPLLYGEGQKKAEFRLQREIQSWGEELGSLDLTSPMHALSREDFPDIRSKRDEEAEKNKIRQEQAEKKKKRQELIQQLFFDQIDERLLSLNEAHKRTCKWFLDTERYKNWMNPDLLHRHHGFLWIKGKPGAGKSTLMRFLDTTAKASTKSKSDSLVASFFFNARGSDLERCTIGLYRSLLWQLLDKAPDLEVVVDELERNAQWLIQNKGWPLQILKRTLANIVKRLGIRSLQIYVDALDECDDRDIADMITFFEDLGEQALEANIGLYICFSSRHYPTITIQNGEEMVLEHEEEHDMDITHYIQSTLRISDSEKAGTLKAQILEKSAGVFLWVALVIPMLNNVSSRGRIEELQQCLDGIPPGLDDLFEMMLTRDNAYVPEFRLCIQWILFAKRPLRQDEYFFALRSAGAPCPIKSWLSGDISEETMRLFVLSSSKGLAQLTKTRDKDQVPNVQFIHESVRDFFLTKKGYLTLWPGLDKSFAASSHEALRDRCLAEIESREASIALRTLNQSTAQPISKVPEHDFAHIEDLNEKFSHCPLGEISDLRKKVSKRCPLLGYAVESVLHHADTAQGDADTVGMFLASFPFKYWIFLSNLFSLAEVRPRSLKASPLYIFAEENLPTLIKSELDRIPHMDIKGEYHSFPLFAACYHGNKEAIRALLMQEDVPRQNANIAFMLDRCQNSKTRPQCSPLLFAIMNGEVELAHFLLRIGKVDINATNSRKQTPLMLAAMNGYEAIVKSLLEWEHINVNAKDFFGNTSLHLAASTRHGAVAKLLLEARQRGVELKDNWPWMPSLWAEAKEHNPIVDLLLATGRADVNAKNNEGETPLYLAAKSGHEYGVKRLLEMDSIDIGAQNPSGKTPLCIATENGHEATVKMLVEANPRLADIRDADGLTPLMRASWRGNLPIVKLLLQPDQVELNVKDDKGRTALNWALWGGHESTIEMLKSHGAVSDSK